MVVLGYESTLPVTLDEMLHHTRAVRRGTRRALVVSDMPYGTYHADTSEALRKRCSLREGRRREAVKVEGGERRLELIARLTEAEIPVMGHVGLTPQSLNALGGYRVQGKTSGGRGTINARCAGGRSRGTVRCVLVSGTARSRPRASPASCESLRIGNRRRARLRRPDPGGERFSSASTFGQTPKFARQYANVGEAISNAVRDLLRRCPRRHVSQRRQSYHSGQPAKIQENRSTSTARISSTRNLLIVS